MEIYCKLLTTLTARAICGANNVLLIVCSKSEFIGLPCQKCSFNRTIKCCFSAIYWLMSTDTLFSCIGRCPGNLPTIKLWSKKLFTRIRQVNVNRVKGSINLQLDFKNKKTYDELKRDFISRNYQINDNRLLTNSLQNDEWLQLVRTSHRTQHSSEFAAQNVAAIQSRLIPVHSNCVEFPDRIFHSQQRVEVDKFHV